MKLIPALAVLAVALAPVPRAAADVYVRPLVQHTTATNVFDTIAPDQTGRKFGGRIAVGCRLGANHEFDLGLEYSSTECRTSYGYDLGNPYRQSQITERFELNPLLATIRDGMRDKTAPVRPYVGWSVGVAFLTSHYSSQSTYYATVSDSSRSGSIFAAGGLAGMQVRLGERVNLDAGYRYCEISSSRLTETNVNTNTFLAGIGFRF